jgi:hypothetical protein
MREIWSRFLGYELVLHCFDRARRGNKGREIHYAVIRADTREATIQKAKDKGWLFFGNMDEFKPGAGVYDVPNAIAFCPHCVAKGRKPPPSPVQPTGRT